MYAAMHGHLEREAVDLLEDKKTPEQIGFTKRLALVMKTGIWLHSVVIH